MTLAELLHRLQQLNADDLARPARVLIVGQALVIDRIDESNGAPILDTGVLYADERDFSE
jgi:hypothetical protein